MTFSAGGDDDGAVAQAPLTQLVLTVAWVGVVASLAATAVAVAIARPPLGGTITAIVGLFWLSWHWGRNRRVLRTGWVAGRLLDRLSDGVLDAVDAGAVMLVIAATPNSAQVLALPTAGLFLRGLQRPRGHRSDHGSRVAVAGTLCRLLLQSAAVLGGVWLGLAVGYGSWRGVPSGAGRAAWRAAGQLTDAAPGMIFIAGFAALLGVAVGRVEAAAVAARTLVDCGTHLLGATSRHEVLRHARSAARALTVRYDDVHVHLSQVPTDADPDEDDAGGAPSSKGAPFDGRPVMASTLDPSLVPGPITCRSCSSLMVTVSGSAPQGRQDTDADVHRAREQAAPAPIARRLMTLQLVLEEAPGVLLLQVQGGERHLRDVRAGLELLAQQVRLTLRKFAAQEELRRLAETDHLTGLATRAVLEKAMTTASTGGSVDGEARSGGACPGVGADSANDVIFENDVIKEHESAADHRRTREGSLLNTIVLLDCNDFKVINDTLGHATGDAVLVEAADRMRRALRFSDVAARLGGDEFAVLLSARTAEETRLVIQELRQTLSVDVQVDHRRVPFSCSVGTATIWAGGTPEEYLRAADQAMYADKNARRRERRTERTDQLAARSRREDTAHTPS